jgi:hypothetical protein
MQAIELKQQAFRIRLKMCRKEGYLDCQIKEISTIKDRAHGIKLV